MERKTKVDDIRLFLTTDGWRAEVEIFSTTGEGNLTDNFRALVNFPVANVNLTPDELKVIVFDHFRDVFKEVGGVLERSTFDSLWPTDIFWEGAK